MTYEYKVVPAPTRGLKAKGVKTPEDRFANALQSAMNELAADGWEYLRTDTLPAEQREGFMSKTTVYQNMLVFRRTKAAQTASAPAPQARPVKAEPAVTVESNNSEPPLTQQTPARRRSEAVVTRPLNGAERLSAADKQELLNADVVAKSDKPNVAAE